MLNIAQSRLNLFCSSLAYSSILKVVNGTKPEKKSLKVGTSGTPFVSWSEVHRFSIEL